MRGSAVLFAVVALLLAGGAGRLAYIEVSKGAVLRASAERQQRATRVIAARRGEILDTRGRVLAGTVRHPSVFVDPGLLQDVRFAAHSLAPILGLDAAGLERQLSEAQAEGSRFLWLKRRVTPEQLEAVERVTATRHLRAFDSQYEPARVYPQGNVAPHVLGFVGVDRRVPPDDALPYEDLCGREGLEAAYDDFLAGRPGRRTLTVDVGRRAVRAPVDSFLPAIDGAALVLTIDAYIQQVTQKVLAETVAKYAADWGVAIVFDPWAGEVLAMATIPGYDLDQPVPANFNDLGDAAQQALRERWRNRAVADSFEPGSMFKPFVASCALADGIVKIDEVFGINGPVRDFGRRTIRDTHPYGALTLHEIISKSSNIGMGMVGGRCGMERLHRFVRMFGFGDVTGIGLPGEHTGLVQDFSRWNPSFSPQSIPIGQEIAVTPIQVVTAFSVFCNGGVLLRPRIVRGIIGPDGTTIADYSRPIAIRRVLDEQTAESFRLRALVETVTDGTGKSAKLDEYQVFGKTGTAQVARAGGHGYQPGKYVGSFIGGAPSDNPRAVVLVSIYKPSKEGYYGGVVAAPAVREILGETLAYMQVPPELAADTQANRPGAVKRHL
jgi:cell division protein FtsI/penicillin-binding protein 2